MTHKKHYNSIQDLYRDTEAQARPHAEYTEKTILYWHGVEDAEHIFTYAKTGWTDGVRRTREALKGLGIPRISSFRRQRRQSDFGDYVDMQRIYSGDVARAWTKTVRVQDKAHRQLAPVTLFVAVSANCNRSADEFFWRGAVAATLADAIQSAGRPVQIVAYEHGRDTFTNGDDSLISVEVKEADMPLDMGNVAYQLALAGFFRTWLLAAIDRMADRQGLTVRGNYGHSDHKPMKPDDINHVAGASKAVYVDNIWCQDQAQAWLDQKLKAVEEGIL
ncbi:MAG: hypothetical protein AB1696_23415 [Planctomycetota bacterium]